MQAPDPFGWVGSTINGQFAVQTIAGEGGFAIVYRGTHLGLEEPIAIKCLNLPARLSADEQESFLATFRAEARLLHRLSRQTANIVQALDIGAATAPSGHWTPYIVMEWLQGMTQAQDLDARCKLGGRPRGLDAAIRILTPAAEALGIAHQENVSHRDVKPANLFLWRSGSNTGMKVLDFGLAKVFSETPSLSMAIDQTSEGRRALTPQYGAPEQFSLNYGATGPWTDVFAMALVIIEVASGRRVLHGETVSDLFMASLEAHQRLELLDGVIPPDSQIPFVLRRALTVNPALRFQSMDALWSALDEARRTVREPLGATVPTEARVGSSLELAPTVDKSALREMEAVLDSQEDVPRIRRKEEQRPTPGEPMAETRAVDPSEPVQTTAFVRSDPRRADDAADSPPRDDARTASENSRLSPLRRSGGWVGLASAALVGVVALILWWRSVLPPIEPFSTNLRGIVLVGPWLENPEGRALCGELKDLDGKEAVQCHSAPLRETNEAELRAKARGAGAVVLALVADNGMARVFPLGQLEENGLLGNDFPVDMTRSADRLRLVAVLSALARLGAPSPTLEPEKTPCPGFEPGALDRLALLALLLVPSCAAEPIDPQQLLDFCAPEQSDADASCALADYLYADRCAACPHARAKLERLRDQGPDRLRIAAKVKLAREDCKRRELDKATQAVLELSGDGSACVQVAAAEVAACIVSAAGPGDGLAARLEEVEALPIANDSLACPPRVRAMSLAKRAYWRGKGGRWAQAFADYEAAYRLSPIPLYVLAQAEAMLHQKQWAQAHAFLKGIKIKLDGKSELYAALLRSLAARRTGAPDAKLETEALVQLYKAVPVGARALQDDSDDELCALACPKGCDSTCSYKILAYPKNDASLDRLVQSLHTGE